MANKTKIAKHLCSLLGGPFVVHKRAVYVPDFSFYLNGIGVEGTPYKDTVYAWHLRVPFFYPITFLDLSWSKRFDTGHITGTDTKIAATIHEYIHQRGLADHLAMDLPVHALLPRNPRELSDAIDRPGSVIDQAAAAFLAGDAAFSAECVAFCRRWLVNEDRVRAEAGIENSAFQEMLRDALPMFCGPADQVKRLLRTSIHQNAAKLGFVAASPDL